MRQQGGCPFRGWLPWLLPLLLLCPNPAAALGFEDFGNGTPERFETLVRPGNAGPFGSGQQLQAIRSYCAAMNISDYVCRRIGRIIFAAKNHEEGASGTLWDNNHRPSGAESDDWGDPRMAASVDTGGTAYTCMALRFEPPLEGDWSLSFHWNHGRHGSDGNRGTSVNLRVAGAGDTGALTTRENYIGSEQVTFAHRPNFSNGFLGWQRVVIVPSQLRVGSAETRWCFYSANARGGSNNRIRLDGVSFGRPRQTFCRPELNAGTNFCSPGHNDFIDRYCTALNLTTANCQQVSRLVFSRTGDGEHVWDPTHNAGSQSGSAPSVLSPAVAKGDFSCLSMLLARPHPAGRPIGFDWVAGRRAGYSGESGRVDAVMRFYYFAPGGGTGHTPIDSDGRFASSKAFHIAGIGASGFGDWETPAPVSDIAESAGVGELKWCYFGGNSVAGNGDRGRLDRLSFDTVLFPQDYQNGIPTDDASLERPAGAGLFSGTQHAEIQGYCDGLNISDHNCRRISRIGFFAKSLPSGVPVFWDNNHRSVLFGDSEPPYDDSWGDPRMVASPGICTPGDSPGVCANRLDGFSTYSCMALVFDPPIPTGWDLEYRWTVGARQDTDNSQGGTAVDIRFRAGTGSGSDIQLSAEPDRFRENTTVNGFLPWQYQGSPGFGSPVPEIRWCFFSSDIRQSVRDLARIDGVLFGTDDGEEFCRPEHNADDNDCRPGHNAFIDRYCLALDIADGNCAQVSRLVFSRSGIGEHVWDPTHAEASADGGSLSVLSPPIKGGEYSCMSLHLTTPYPRGEEFNFAWELGRRAGFDGETGQVNALMRFYYFAAGAGAGHDPTDSETRSSDAFLFLRPEQSGFQGWTNAQFSDTDTEAEELKWCYYGGNPEVGAQDRGRIDRLQLEGLPIPPRVFANSTPQRTASLERPVGVGLFSNTTQSRSIQGYCDGMNISDYNCRRISRIDFFARNLPPGATPFWDNDHRLLSSGDLDPPYDERWGDPRMLASPATTADSSSYGCMALVFDPPIQRGWELEFRWTVGARHDTNDRQTGGTAVDVRFGADTDNDSDIVLTEEPGRFRQNTMIDGFLPWQHRRVTDFDRPVADVRWCFFASNILAADRNLARIDGVLFGTAQTQLFCRPELNPAGIGCVPGHNDFIDRYCLALDLAADNCALVSRLAFSNSGAGEPVWDPTHTETSTESSSFSVLSPPVRLNGYSCMSLYLDTPNPRGAAFSFDWDLGRRAKFEGEGGREPASMRFYYFARGAGADHDPLDLGARISDASLSLGDSAGGFSGWETVDIDAPATAAEELKWCYYGGNSEAGVQDRGRVDRLRLASFEDIAPRSYANGLPQRTKTLTRPAGVGLFSSSTQSRSIRNYCDGLNISDYNCRRISRIRFDDRGVASSFTSFWNSLHMGLVDTADLDPPYDERWGDPIMVAAESRGPISNLSAGDHYSCMALVFDPPLPSGWNMEFRWTLGAKLNTGDSQGSGTAVDVRLGAISPPGSDIVLSDEPGRFRQNTAIDGLLPWRSPQFSDFSSPVAEVRWCFFASNTLFGEQNLARIDGVLFGTTQTQAFCRPELNAAGEGCLGEHNTLIDRYCTALDLHPLICEQVSRLAFSRTGSGEHVWDPTHTEASDGGGSSSVLSPPVRGGEYSCLSLYLHVPNPEGVAFGFDWDLSRRAGLGGELGLSDAAMRFYSFAPGEGDNHAPLDDDGNPAGSSEIISLGSAESGFKGWETAAIDEPSSAVGELKWCYFGGNPTVGAQDRGRLDRLQLRISSLFPERYAGGMPLQTETLTRPSGVDLFSSSTQSRSIRDYCDGLNISDYNCRRISQIRFVSKIPGVHAIVSSGVTSFWDNDHRMLEAGDIAGLHFGDDLDPPYRERWGDARMVASPFNTTDSSSFSCMALVFDPPLPSGWDLEFRWTVGARHDDGDSEVRGTAVDVRLGANTQATSDIRLTDEPGRSRQNTLVDGFLPWQYHSISDFDSPVPEVRWCFFSSNIRLSLGNLARIDGVLFGTDAGEEFCRPALNAGDTGCLAAHNTFIDRYCVALDLSADNCAQVSRLGFSRGSRAGGGAGLITVGPSIGEHVWDPTHAEASAGGGGSSVLSPPVKGEEFSCMSLTLATPHPAGEPFEFTWDVSRRAAGRDGPAFGSAFMFLNLRAPEAAPLTNPFADEFALFRIAGEADWGGWVTASMANPPTAIEEFKWCYQGDNFEVGERDRGRLDRLQIAALAPLRNYASGTPQQAKALTRPAGVGLFSNSTQSRSIRDYCDGMNISDHGCRRIRQIRFVSQGLPSGATPFWDNDHRMVPSGDLDPPYYQRWGEPRMLASPAISTDSSSYSCMALVFDPPLPSGWNLEFRWTVGARHDDGDREVRGTAVDVRFGANTQAGSDIRLNDQPQNFRQNTEFDGFLPWRYRGFADFDSPVPEVRWCFFSSDILAAERNLARIDGVLFGTDAGEEFCRPQLNTGDTGCLPGHNAFIDRYCVALDLSAENCAQVSRLGFSRNGSGEHVWDPTHTAASAEGGGLSVLSPPSKGGERSCMSLWLATPHPAGEPLSFEWDYNSGEGGSLSVGVIYALRAPGSAPFSADNPRSGSAFHEDARTDSFPGNFWRGWQNESIGNPADAVEELRWCYLGDQIEAGVHDRMRLDRLQLAALTQLRNYAGGIPQQAEVLNRPAGVGLFSNSTQSRSIRDYCDGMNIADYGCRRIRQIRFVSQGLPAGAAPFWDNDHRMVASGDLDPPYYQRWGEPRMLASPAISTDSSSFSCMALVFEPPLPSGWNMEFRWTVGARHDDGDNRIRGAAVDVQFGANTQAGSDIRLTDEQENFRQNTDVDGFLPWRHRGFADFDSPVPEVRWCIFSSDILAAERNLARIDGVLFGTDAGEEFCRPQLNAGDTGCLAGHNAFIDRYCVALDISADNCAQVSRLGFSRSGIGEHVWDPTHTEASAGGGSFSVLSPPVKAGEYSCMSLRLATPHPAGEPLSFEWDINRGAGPGVDGVVLIHHYLRAPGSAPFSADDPTSDSVVAQGANLATTSGWFGWDNESVSNPATAVEELRWCYFGDHIEAGQQDRGRLDRLQLAPLIPPDGYANGVSQQQKTLLRPEGSGLFGSSQSRSIGDYCDGLNMSDYNCRRISRIGFFALDLPTGTALFWDNDHRMVASGDSSPPYDERWGDARMVASPAISTGSTSYSCMAVVFDPPIPPGWNMEFRWTVGARSDDNRSRGTAVDVQFGGDTRSSSDIRLTEVPGRFRRNIGVDGFLPWQQHSITDFDSPVPEVRWCFFSSNILAAERNLARIDGVLFGTTQTQAFCRPGLNADDAACRSEHGNFIDRYCTALDLHPSVCEQVSRLVFSRTGTGEHVWDPTHAEVSTDGGSSSLLSPPVMGGEYSCLSLFLHVPNPEGEAFGFNWNLNRRVGLGGESEATDAVMRFYHFAPGEGDNHAPLDANGNPASSNGVLSLGPTKSRLQRWEAVAVDEPATAVGELKWCYFGGNPTVGAQDRGRIDRLQLRLTGIFPSRYAGGTPGQSKSLTRPAGVGLFSSSSQSQSIRDYCDGLNISAHNCRRIRQIRFVSQNLPSGTTPFWDNDHRMVASGDLDPPYSGRWGESRMLASPAISADSSSFSCMALVFDPPLPSGWNLEFRWTVGARHDDGDSQIRGTAVDVRLGANTQAGSTIVLTIEPGRSRQNIGIDGFLPWQYRSITDFDSPVPEVRWCFFSSNILAAERNLARIDGVLFGTTQTQAFCRPELNAGDAGCLDGHNAFIDRYCVALDLTDDNCAQVSRLAFRRGGLEDAVSIGEHVWDPTHIEASEGGGGLSVLSPPVKGGDYSCMSLYLATPYPAGERFDFTWDLNRRVAGKDGRFRGQPIAAFFLRTPGSAPLTDPVTDGPPHFRFGVNLTGDWLGWARESLGNPAAIEEFRWCYFGDNTIEAGERDRMRLDRLQIVALMPLDDYANGGSQQRKTLLRPEGAGLFSSSSQSRSIGDYCDGLNISDYNCRRISRIGFFARNLPTGATSLWDNDHRMVASGDLDPPYYDRWGEPRMLASPAISADSSSYSCMAVVFDPPIPSGWNMEFRWTVGARHDDGDGQVRGTAVDVRFGANTLPNSAIGLNDEQARFRQNTEFDGFLPWRTRGFVDFDSPVPEVRWCFFSSDILAAERNLARIDGVLFGTTQTQAFCRPGLNAGDAGCLAAHNDFIDRYCVALDLPDDHCAQVSRLAFSRSGIGEHVWDPTHTEASDDGGSFSVLSPPVRADEHSCMSLYLDPPHPQEEAFGFTWDLSRRQNRSGGGDNFLGFFFFAPGAGDDHRPEDFRSGNRDDDIFRMLTVTQSGFQGWAARAISDHGTAVGELKWCYYGGNEEVGAQDIGRVDRLLIIEGTVLDFLLPEPNPGPAVVEGMVASIRLRSPIPLAAGQETTIRLIVEQGQRFLDPDSPPVVSTMPMVADMGLSARLVLEFTITGDGEAKEYDLALPTHDDDRIDGAGNIVLSLAEPPPSAEYLLGTTDSGYLLAVEDNDRLILDAEALVSWWQLVAQCTADGSGDCFQPGAAAPSLENSPNLPDRTQPQLDALAVAFQDLVDAGLLDFNADGSHDTLDLRLFLRYLAGLRGEALGSEPLNTGTLNALRR